MSVTFTPTASRRIATILAAKGAQIWAAEAASEAGAVARRVEATQFWNVATRMDACEYKANTTAHAVEYAAAVAIQQAETAMEDNVNTTFFDTDAHAWTRDALSDARRAVRWARCAVKAAGRFIDVEDAMDRIDEISQAVAAERYNFEIALQD